jgi:predicted nucleic acid-binding protein
MIYFDAAFLVKLFAGESDSAKVVEFVQRKNEVIASSITSRMEVIAALHRKYREGGMSHFAMLKAHEQFLREIEEGRISCILFTPEVVYRVEEGFRKLPANVFLRTGDAIHLATAAEAGFKEIYSNDRHLLAAASIFKLKAINPLGK